MNDKDRGTGRTVRQMGGAPHRAIFVWVNRNINDAKHLARKHGRPDLEIVSPAWLTDRLWMGRELSGIVVDHDTRLTDRQYESYLDALARVRS